MKLNLDKLRERLKLPVTTVTAVTANVYTASRCHPQDSKLVTAVTNPDSVTSVTSRHQTEKTESVNVYAGVTAVTAVTKENWQSLSGWEHSAWQDDFNAWLLEACVFRDRYFWSIGHLHTAFSDWCLASERVPCTRETFVALVLSEGFSCTDGLIFGLSPRDAEIETWALSG